MTQDCAELERLLAEDGIRAVYQPIVELASGAVVGYEALARGPLGSTLERPDHLFAAARAAGRVAELDWACRIAALAGAEQAQLRAPLALFINVEPAALGTWAPAAFTKLAERVAGQVPVVVEFTERALGADPAGLLRAAEGIRARGWRIAVDDVGADPASLALMPFLAPDVIKLDLSLVQQRTTIEIAEVISAVNAQAERTGAIVLAEGIETAEHARLAAEMGARLGQGWLFGRPGELPPSLDGDASGLASATVLPSVQPPRTDTPYQLVARSRAVQRASKPLLVAMSKHLELQALALGAPAVVGATFQHARQFSPATVRRYTRLAESAVLVVALAEVMPSAPAPGVVGAACAPDDPIVEEWSLVVVGPHFAGAVLARDLGDPGPEDQRRFDYVVTYDRDLVVAAAVALLRRVPSAAELPQEAVLGL